MCGGDTASLPRPAQLRAQALTRVSGDTPRTCEWGLLRPHPCLSRQPCKEDLWVFVRELWWGQGGCSVSPKFEFPCFSWRGLILNLQKGIFCLEQTCGGKRTFVQKEMFLASMCYIAFTLLRSRCLNTEFCLLVCLMAQFPLLFAFIMNCSLGRKSAMEIINK